MRTIAALAVTLALTGGVAHAKNLTSLGVNPAGNTVWRITNTSDAPRLVTLSRHGGGHAVQYSVNPGELLVVEGAAPGTYIATFDDGTRKTKASGPQAYTPPSSTGPKGEDGKDGKDGADGRSIDPSQYLSDMATVIGIGGLEMRTPFAGGFVWSAGVATFDNALGTDHALSLGLGYGINPNLSVYVKVSIGQHSRAAFIGLEGRF